VQEAEEADSNQQTPHLEVLSTPFSEKPKEISLPELLHKTEQNGQSRIRYTEL